MLYFFKSLWTKKKFKKLRPKMTKIASRGWSQDHESYNVFSSEYIKSQCLIWVTKLGKKYVLGWSAFILQFALHWWRHLQVCVQVNRGRNCTIRLCLKTDVQVHQCIQLGTVKLARWPHWVHVTQVHHASNVSVPISLSQAASACRLRWLIIIVHVNMW